MPTAKKSDAELFEYTTPSGVKVTLPALPRLKNKDMQDLRRSSLYDQTITLANRFASEEQLVELGEVYLDEMTDLANAWMKFSTDLTLGE